MQAIRGQSITRAYETDLDLAVRYYSIFSIVYNLKLARRHIQLLAYTAIKGNISSGPAKQGFLDTFGSSRDHLDNLVSQLYKKKLLVKRDKRTFVNPQIALDFSNKIAIQLNLSVDASKKG